MDVAVAARHHRINEGLCALCTYLFAEDRATYERVRQLAVGKTLAAHPPNGDWRWV